MTSIVSRTSAWADTFGHWHARITFSHTLSESDPRAEFSLQRWWPRIRRIARDAIVHEITDREQKTGEPYAAAERRVRASLPRLVVVTQNVDSLGRWHGVTLSEAPDPTRKLAA